MLLALLAATAPAVAFSGTPPWADPDGGGSRLAPRAGPEAAVASAASRFDRRRVILGRSVQGRKLVATRVGNAAAGRSVLLVGEIHGDEGAGRKIVKRFRRTRARFRDAAVWTVVSANPDGHAADRRGNARGVDLNRNFPVGWSGAEPPGSGYYAGARPFSEPESRALRRLVRRIDPELSIHYHQPWGSVLAPCGGSARPERRYARIVRLPVERCRGERLPGTLTRWQESRGNNAFVVELPAGKVSRAERRRHVRAAAATFVDRR